MGEINPELEKPVVSWRKVMCLVDRKGRGPQKNLRCGCVADRALNIGSFKSSIPGEKVNDSF